MSRKKFSLYEHNVVGPEALAIKIGTTNPDVVTRWLRNVELYQKAMTALDRVTMLIRDDDEGTLYLASVEECL